MTAMYLAPLFYLLTTLTCLALTTPVQLQHTILATLPSTKCPCTLTVSIPHPLSTTRRRRRRQQQPRPLDILVSAANDLNFVPDLSLSRYNYTTSHATARDALFSYHHLHIDAPSQIRVQVRQWRSPDAVADNDRAFITVQRQGKRCPVILGAPHETPSSPTPPSEDTGQPTGEAPTFSPGTTTPVRLRSAPKRLILRLPEEEEPQNVEAETTARDAALKVSERETQPRIVGGQAAKRSLANFLAYIKIPSPKGMRACSGTVIGRRLVLTAAHCGAGISSTVYVGARQGNPSDGTPIAVESVNNHELFTSVQTGHFRYDIALITLKNEVPNDIEFMKVNVNTSVPVEKSIVRAAGYGILSHRNQYSNPNAQLYHVDVPVVPRRTCVNAYGAEGVSIDYSYQVCAGYFGRGGCDSCQGDSGGPLFQYDTAGIPVIVGIVSIGVECANARFPGVYVRTSTHGEFLPKDGITRSYDAVAVFSDFVPVTVIRTETIILAATGGVIVLLAVLFLGFIAVSKWKRTSSTGVDPSAPPPPMHEQAALPPPPMPHRHHPHPYVPMSSSTTATSGMDGTSTTGSHTTHHHGATGDDDDAGIMMNQLGWGGAPSGMAFQESQRLSAVHDDGIVNSAQMQQLQQHQMQGVPAYVLAAQFDNFDPYERHDGGNGADSGQVPLEVPNNAVQQSGAEAAGMPAVQAQLEVYPSNADGIRLNEARPPQ